VSVDGARIEGAGKMKCPMSNYDPDNHNSKLVKPAVVPESSEKSMKKMPQVYPHEVLVIVLLLIVGGVGMWSHAHVLLVVDHHRDSPYALYRLIMFGIALISGLVAPRISLLSALSLFVLQPVVANKILPPDPLLPTGMAFLFLLCLLGTWLGQLLRRH